MLPSKLSSASFLSGGGGMLRSRLKIDSRLSLGICSLTGPSGCLRVMTTSFIELTLPTPLLLWLLKMSLKRLRWTIELPAVRRRMRSNSTFLTSGESTNVVAAAGADSSLLFSSSRTILSTFLDRRSETGRMPLSLS